MGWLNRRPVLTTERLRLEPLVEAHAEHVIALNSDPAVMRHITGDAQNAEESRASLAELTRDQRGLGYWAGFEEDEFVGVWALTVESGDRSAAELSCRLIRSAWGRGLASEGCRALLEHGFSTIGLVRVWGETMAVNTRSRAVMEHLGMSITSTDVGTGEDPLPGWEQGELVYTIDVEHWAGAPEEGAGTGHEPSYWDGQAASFDLEPDHGLTNPTVRATWRSLLLEVLPPAPGRVADLGCGTGTLSLLLAGEGYAVDGLDASAEMIRLARIKADGHPGTRFIQGDAEDPDLAPGAYDVVLSRHVLWAMADPAAALARWIGLLAPGGRLVLIEGLWQGGVGLSSDQTVALVNETGRRSELRPLQEATYWGREVTDERYVVVS